MSLRQTASVAEYKAAHDVLAAKSKLPTAQRLLFWEQGLKAEIRAECKLNPLTHKAYSSLSAAQSAAMAVDAHLSSAAAVKKRTSGPTVAAATVSKKTKRESDPEVQWSTEGNTFNCAKNGMMALPLPGFFSKWIESACPLRHGKPLLPRGYISSSVSQPFCFAKGCTGVHVWSRCPTLAHKIWAKVSKE